MGKGPTRLKSRISASVRDVGFPQKGVRRSITKEKKIIAAVPVKGNAVRDGVATKLQSKRSLGPRGRRAAAVAAAAAAMRSGAVSAVPTEDMNNLRGVGIFNVPKPKRDAARTVAEIEEARLHSTKISEQLSQGPANASKRRKRKKLQRHTRAVLNAFFAQSEPPVLPHAGP
mmetsp:Transcript_24552/g.47757  ORF Transcript_24552/g.47757 Transcript_24552/m.47757 type:complete len:172 (-) Transcript_24552:180-695(-)|eukprot:CAMPEP_0172807306 /NCGR_PEP_ID=MMETSP1075-20121228/6921_1 /TAXON_ID=2916 /ORGANISM="Ceratium fusus, Strain PA161109" /LENGTH=171 /DNA_ID=CAMNT_0013646271 /DNA_START=46 /DNA_END=561 /DNA_ORIENTATION=+